MTKEDLQEQLKICDDELKKELQIVLEKHEYNPLNILRICVASLLGVNEIDLLTNSKKTQHSQARWFFWMAYKRMTNETYERMAQLFSIEGHHFHTQSIINSVGQMNRLVQKDRIWARRWEKIKEIINIIQNGR